MLSLKKESIFKGLDNSTSSILLGEVEFKTLLHTIITETLCIANEVTSVSNDIHYHIEKHLQKNTYTEPKFGGQFRMFIFNKFFKINWTVFDLDIIDNTSFSFGANVDFENGKINLNIPKIYGDLDWSFLRDSLQHEIEHIYQRFKRGDDSNFNHNDKKLYDTAVILSMNCKSQIYRDLGNAVYLMFNAEQDAYVNGMYSAMKIETDPKLKQEIYYRSDAYRQFSFLNDYLIRLQTINNEKDIKELEKGLKVLHKNMDWLKDNIKKAIKRFIKKIGKGYTHAMYSK